MKERKSQDQLERLAKKYLFLMKRGRFNDARLVVRLLESSTYVNDSVWVQADKRKSK